MVLVGPLAGLSGRFGEQFGQSDEVIGGDGDPEDGRDFHFAADLDLGKTGLRLDPAEDFLNALAAT